MLIVDEVVRYKTRGLGINWGPYSASVEASGGGGGGGGGGGDTSASG